MKLRPKRDGTALVLWLAPIGRELRYDFDAERKPYEPPAWSARLAQGAVNAILASQRAARQVEAGKVNELARLVYAAGYGDGQKGRPRRLPLPPAGKALKRSWWDTLRGKS